jgi:hypothetical protein
MAAGAINALAGGGTLITFPALVAVGLPPVVANVTSTVSLCPGYLGATLAQKKDLKGQMQRLWWAVPAGAVGGVLGVILLLNTGEKLFREIVPYLILMAAALLAVQDPVRAWVARRRERNGSRVAVEYWAVPPIILAAIYGGYFGAGLSVITLAVLGLMLDDTLTRLNALKQAVSFSVNVAAAIYIVLSGPVAWLTALVMAAGALTGGVIGGKLAGRVKPATLRWIVVTIGTLVAIIYLIRG